MGIQCGEYRSKCNGLQIKAINGQGSGVFTRRSFKLNEEILVFGGTETPTDLITDFTHFLQISPDLYLCPSGQFDDYVNHSCDPNCAVFFQKNIPVLKAIKNIKSNIQLTFDYGTIMFNEPTIFECACKSKNCRKVIGNFYTLPADLQNKYLERGMVPLLTKYTREELGI